MNGPSPAEPGAGRSADEFRAVEMLMHDMRAALGGITGGLALLDARGLDEGLRRQLDRIGASAEMLATLIECASDLAAIAARDGTAAAAPVDVARFLRNMGRMWQAEAERRGLRLRVGFDADVPDAVVADETRLKRIIANLVGNAVKYTETGSVTLRVRGLDGGVAFEVEDTGPGLSEAARERLFEPYGRPEGSAAPGHGLGLHIARTLARQMGGEVTLDPAPGGGCLARLVLPGPGSAVAPAPAPAPAAPAAPPRPAAPAAPAPAQAHLRIARPGAEEAAEDGPSGPALPDLAHLSVLMAEDNVTNQLVAGQMLRTMGALVTVASDGAEALAALDRDRFDLLLVDIEMPRVSGLEVIRRVRAMPDDRAGLPVIALTAYAMREHRERIGAAGADGLIAKPILGIREFGEQILAIAARRNRARPTAPAARSPAPVQAEVYDQLAAAIGPEGMAELLLRLEEDLASVGKGIARGLARGDMAELRANSHILVSVAGAVGALPLQQDAEALNRAAHAGAAAEVAALGARIAERVDELVAFVRGRRGAG